MSQTATVNSSFILALALIIVLPILYLYYQASYLRPPKISGETAKDEDAELLQIPLELGDVRVSKLLVHPIKSCRGTSVTEVNYNPEGLENDRKWCVVRADTHVIMTARELPRLVLVTPRIEPDDSHPCGGKLVVSFPENSGCVDFEVPLNPTPAVLQGWEIIDECRMFFVADRADGYICQSLSSPSGSPSPSDILSEYCKRPVHLLMKGPKRRDCAPTLSFPDLKASVVFQDGFPLLIASEESLGQVRKRINEYARRGGAIKGIDRRWEDDQIDMERFRPNIVIAGTGVPFAEDMIKELVISPDRDTPSPETPGIHLVKKCARCLLPNIDTLTGVRDAAVPYKILMKVRKGKDPEVANKPCFGVNAVPSGTGIIRVGDFVHVREWEGASV